MQVEYVKSFRVDFYLKTTTAYYNTKLFSIFWEIYFSSKNMLRTLTSGSYEDYFVIQIVRYSIKIQNIVYFLGHFCKTQDGVKVCIDAIVDLYLFIKLESFVNFDNGNV